MQSNLEKLDSNFVCLEIRLEPKEVDDALGEAYLRVVKKAKVPGFRPGKTPRAVLEAHYGKEILYEDAMDILVAESYHDALHEHDLSPIDRPDLQIIEPLAQGNPFVFKANLQVLPEVVLGQYTGVKAEKSTVNISDEDVTHRLAALREQHAELVLSDKEELSAGDFAVVDFDGYADGEPFKGGSAKGYTIQTASEGYLPGFSEGLLGMRTGETREITITLPADYPAGELAGKEAKFQVTVREIKQKELPDLDDEFAKSLGANSFGELTEQVRQSMVASGENEADKAYAESIVEKIVAGAQVEIPAMLADRQVEQRYQTLIKNLAYQGLTIDKYLTEVGKAEEELREEIRPRAEGEVRTDLVLEAVRKAEKIEATDEEIERRVSELAAVSRQKDVSAFRRELERSGRLGTMIDNLAREKTVKFLVEKAIIDMAD